MMRTIVLFSNLFFQDFSLLPERATLAEKIQQMSHSESMTNQLQETLLHLLYWCGASAALIEMLTRTNASMIQRHFFWIAILNPSADIQPIFEHVLTEIRTQSAENTLELISMLVKAQRNHEAIDHLLEHGHIEFADVDCLFRFHW
jgi:hypothetical protein